MTNGDSSLINLKNSTMSLPVPEDLGFCSSEDYLENEVHSTTDSSEDSVEVKVSPIFLVNKKRQASTEKFSGPLKKRMCLKVKAEINETHPFRPWSPAPSKNVPAIKEEVLPVPPLKTEIQPLCQPKQEPMFSSYFRPPTPVKFYQQTEPVSLVKKRESDISIKTETDVTCQDLRVPIHPQIQSLSTAETERMILKSSEIFPTLQANTPENTVLPSTSKKTSESQRREQRNYKNMTRERRIEANARERTRVHTISAAFDTLRRSIPAYSHNQKLSKLSVLRIACSYIMTLSSIVSDNPDSSAPSTSECVDMVSRTIQREGKLRRKKDDND